jgi:UDP-3-O-[3-hydroxymyristoyl] glucosamine N-acyltransferase
MEISARDLAAIINGSIDGNENVRVQKPAKIEEATTGDFSFIDSVKYEQFAYTTGASILLVSNEFHAQKPVHSTLIRVPNVREALAVLLEQFSNGTQAKLSISTDARIHTTAQMGNEVGVGVFSIIGAASQIGDHTHIKDQVYIGAQVKIGIGCIIEAGVKIYDRTVIGDYCVIHANAVIGSDGFGFVPQSDGTWKKMPQVGNVVIGNEVHIGANTCIDRAALGSTTIGSGTKLDNLVHIAHNVVVGQHTAMAAQVGIAGSTEIGAHCLIGGQAGVAGHIKIANGTKIQAQSGIAGTIKEENTAVFGSPAIAYADYVKAYLVFKNLPEMERRLRTIEKTL